jgi:RIO kinase 1
MLRAVTDSLAPLVADGIIDGAHTRLKSGKEADLWIVHHGGEVLAAKVYKARENRSFRNNAGYKEGRQVRNTRTQRAIQRGSRFGQAAAEDAWKAKEADALHALHAAGVRVPRPVMFYEGVLLMELVVDAHGHPAPRLVDAHLGRAEAAALYSDLRAQVVRMLTCDLVHGDLSPYNVLLAWNGPVVIDFPQVVGAAHNSQAEGYFRRDLENLRRFFAALDPALHAAAGDAREIWRAYTRRELTPDFVPTGRVHEPPHHRQPPHGPPARSSGAHHHEGQPGRPPQLRGEQHHPRHGGPAPQGRPPGPKRRPAGEPEVVRVARPSAVPAQALHHPAHPRPQPARSPQDAAPRGLGAAPGPGRRRRRRRGRGR